MTQLEKINELQSTIQFLYEKEGRSINYISKLLEINRQLLSEEIKKKGWIRANAHKLSPSNQKFINKNLNYILKRLKEQAVIADIAQELGITRDKLYYLFICDERLANAKKEYDKNKTNKRIEQGRQSNAFEDLPNEIWKEVLGYPSYYVSNMGRFKKYLPTYDCYRLLALTPNSRNDRLYVCLINELGERKNLIAARLVGFAFCDGHSEGKNTIDHIDGDFTNNKAENLQWVSQATNNQRAYNNNLMTPHTGYSKHGKFKQITVIKNDEPNKEYSFKTITAASRFLGISPTQIQRYLDNECAFDGTIKLVY